jgi:hypothetical protein
MSLLPRVLVFAVCGLVGYFGASAFHSSPRLPAAPAPLPAPSIAAPPLPDSPRSAEASRSASNDRALVAEWEALRREHGGGAAEFPALYASIKEMKDAFRRRAFRSALIAEWAATDPQAGLAYLQQNDRGNASQLMREWLRVDPQAAINGLLTSNLKGREDMRGLLSDIARVAPERLAEVVALLPKSESRWDTTAQDAFAIFAGKNPDAARAAAQALQGPLRGQALAGVARALAETDGAGTLAWAQTLPAGEERDAALKATLAGWAKSNPAAALEKLDLVPPGGDEMYHASDAGAQVLREAAKRDWNGTVKWLRENPGKLGRSSLDGLQSVLTERLTADPLATLHALRESGVQQLSQVLGNVLLNEGYAKRDAIWNWLDSQPSSAFTQAARSSLLNAIAWKEPDVALGFLEKLPDDTQGRELLEQGTRSLLNGGSQMNRFEELLKQASPKVRSHLIEAGFQFGWNFQNTGQDPAKWRGLINELPPERRGEATMALARGWAGIDPEAAINWATSLADARHRESALGSAASVWAANDPYDAAQWINSMPVGSNRDSATMSLVYSIVKNEPESAWTWALSVGNPQRRTQALATAYEALRGKDPAIAQQMLSTARLSPTEVQALQKHSSQP